MNAVLEATTKGDDIFQVVDSISKWHCLQWDILRGCIDGVPAILGQWSGVRARVMEVAPHVTFMHYMIHRLALRCKVLRAELFSVLSLVVKWLTK